MGPPVRFAPVYLALRWRVVCVIQDTPSLRQAVCYHGRVADVRGFIAAQVQSVRHAVNAAGPDDRLLGACDEVASGTRGMRVTVTSSPPAMTAMVRRAAVVHSVIRTRQAPVAPRNPKAMVMLLRCAWRTSAVELVHLLAQLGMRPAALVFNVAVAPRPPRRRAVAADAETRPAQSNAELALLVRGKSLHRLSLNALRAQQARARRTALGLVTTKSHIYACPTCTQIRGFVCPATAATTSGRAPPHGMDNYCAMGTSRCIVDFDENLLYCGRRRAVNAGRRRLPAQLVGEGAHRRVRAGVVRAVRHAVPGVHAAGGAPDDARHRAHNYNAAGLFQCAVPLRRRRDARRAAAAVRPLW